LGPRARGGRGGWRGDAGIERRRGGRDGAAAAAAAGADGGAGDDREDAGAGAIAAVAVGVVGIEAEVIGRVARAWVGACVWVGAALAIGGCGAAADPNAAALHDVEAATRAVDRALGIQTAFVTAGNIDVGAPPDVIATSLWGRLMTEAPGCAAATHAGATVHADFGGGCALATASMRVGGTVDAEVQADATTGGVTVTLALGATVDGQALGGSFAVSTPNGNVFTYGGTLTLDGTTVMAPLVRAGIAGGGATLDVDNATVGGAGFALAAAHQRFAGCYPDGGMATLGALGVAFASETPQTGAVTLSTGKSATLPARAGCPR
jgi:hypothetical protein